MLRLNEAMLRYLKTSQGGDAQARMDLEAQLRGTNTLVARSTSAPPQSAQPNLLDGSVISVKDEWSFVVGNLGEKQGVKIGGAVIQEMDSEKEKIKVGDRLQVDARSSVSLK